MNKTKENIVTLYEKYRKNKEHLKFSVDFTRSEEDEHVLICKIDNIQGRYKKSLEALIGNMTDEAKRFIASEFCINLLKEDKELEYLRFDKTMQNEFCNLLNALFNEGTDIFFKKTVFLATKYKQLYELANVSLSADGELVDRHGNIITEKENKKEDAV